MEGVKEKKVENAPLEEDVGMDTYGTHTDPTLTHTTGVLVKGTQRRDPGAIMITITACTTGPEMREEIKNNHRIGIAVYKTSLINTITHHLEVTIMLGL